MSGYLVKLPKEDKYWSVETQSFVSLDNPIKPTLMELDKAKRFALEFGIDTEIACKICNSKGKVLKKYSEDVESSIWLYLVL